MGYSTRSVVGKSNLSKVHLTFFLSMQVYKIRAFHIGKNSYCGFLGYDAMWFGRLVLPSGSMSRTLPAPP